jgi:hypothetical protein
MIGWRGLQFRPIRAVAAALAPGAEKGEEEEKEESLMMIWLQIIFTAHGKS